ncbi:MAG: hypothetical protein KGJ07_05210, partial [Patescibacteria group bacterium]|nr:hypothetical protein [Patescibacteria group bacterium]
HDKYVLITYHSTALEVLSTNIPVLPTICYSHALNHYLSKHILKYTLKPSHTVSTYLSHILRQLQTC